MSYNGSGQFNINTTGQPVVAGTTISSTAFNALTADLATGLSTTITKDGQSTITANIPWSGYKITGLGAATAAADAVRFDQIQSGTEKWLTVTGTDTYTGSVTPALTAYAAGNTFNFVVPNTNTGASTLNIDGLGAKSITRNGSTALVAGDLVANSVATIVYDGTRFQVENSNSVTNFRVSGTLNLAGSTMTVRSSVTPRTITYIDEDATLVGLTNTQALTGKTYNGLTVTTTTGTFTLANGKTLTANNSLTFAGTDSTTQTFPSSSASIIGSNVSTTLTVGYDATPYNAGTKSSGTFTPDKTNGNFQYAVNGGAHTLAPPSTNCTMIIQYTNNGSAGAITTSGFTKVSGSFTTVNGDDFFAYITVNNGFSFLSIQALQ